MGGRLVQRVLGSAVVALPREAHATTTREIDPATRCQHWRSTKILSEAGCYKAPVTDGTLERPPPYRPDAGRYRDVGVDRILRWPDAQEHGVNSGLDVGDKATNVVKHQRGRRTPVPIVDVILGGLEPLQNVIDIERNLACLWNVQSSVNRYIVPIHRRDLSVRRCPRFDAGLIHSTFPMPGCLTFRASAAALNDLAERRRVQPPVSQSVGAKKRSVDRVVPRNSDRLIGRISNKH